MNFVDYGGLKALVKLIKNWIKKDDIPLAGGSSKTDEKTVYGYARSRLKDAYSSVQMTNLTINGSSSSVEIHSGGTTVIPSMHFSAVPDDFDSIDYELLVRPNCEILFHFGTSSKPKPDENGDMTWDSETAHEYSYRGDSDVKGEYGSIKITINRKTFPPLYFVQTFQFDFIKDS